MKTPNYLSSRIGRLTALFFLFMAKGIPWGFASATLVKIMSEQGVGEEEIALFFSTLMWPWAFKWLFGPILDLFYIKRLGKRRTWLLFGQVVMAVTLVGVSRIDFAVHLKLFTYVMLVHTCFAALHGVVIGALACDVVEENDRGLANGIMSAGAYIGPMVGGSGVLFLLDQKLVSLEASYYWVSLCVLAVTACVTLFIGEKPEPEETPSQGTATERFRREIADYLRTAVRSFLESKPALFGVFFTALPAGAYAFAMSFGTTITEKAIHMSKTEFAIYTAVQSVVPAAFCLIGGWLSDRFGRRKVMALSVVGVALPTLYFAYVLHSLGIVQLDGAANRLTESQMFRLDLIYWGVSIVYVAVQAIGYAVQSAIWMDVTNPAVAATQFTAYSALFNFTRSYYAIVVGSATVKFGCPRMLVFDALFGMLCLIPLFFMTKAKEGSEPVMRSLEADAEA